MTKGTVSTFRDSAAHFQSSSTPAPPQNPDNSDFQPPQMHLCACMFVFYLHYSCLLLATEAKWFKREKASPLPSGFLLLIRLPAMERSVKNSLSSSLWHMVTLSLTRESAPQGNHCCARPSPLLFLPWSLYSEQFIPLPERQFQNLGMRKLICPSTCALRGCKDEWTLPSQTHTKAFSSSVFLPSFNIRFLKKYTLLEGPPSLRPPCGTTCAMRNFINGGVVLWCLSFYPSFSVSSWNVKRENSLSGEMELHRHEALVEGLGRKEERFQEQKGGWTVNGLPVHIRDPGFVHPPQYHK